jgi:hypothetical protein
MGANQFGLHHIFYGMFFKFFFRFHKFRSRFYREIQAVEDDSAWQLHNLFKKIQDPQIRSKVFLHILEEEGHAEIFKKGYQQENSGHFLPKTVSRMTMADENDPLWKFFASLTAGERSAARFFAKLQYASRDGKINCEVNRVLQEELKHVEAGVQAPPYLQVPQEQYSSYVASLEAKQKRQSWVSRAQTILNGLVSLLFLMMYFIFVPFFFLAASRRLQSPQTVFINNDRKVY